MAFKFLQGDVITNLRKIADRSVHCCVTSPPYWGLRDYRRKGQLGLEKTPELYVAKMVEVFREVRRVLRDDATLWLNIGDTYAADRGGDTQPAETLAGGVHGKGEDAARRGRSAVNYQPTRDCTKYVLKHKDLVGIPWMLAFALRADGWYLRQDIIWAKPNPMPESVTDRCTKSHEYMFLLTKQPKYFYDHEGAKEPAAKGAAGSTFNKGKTAEHQLGRAQTAERTQNDGTRNRRNVWTIATQPYKEAHFAVFPEALVRPCLLAGTSRHGCCPTCGEPYRRVVEHTNMVIRRSERTHEKGQTRASGTVEAPATTTTVGWTMECNCPEAPAAPCAVLDPFMGSGTTGAVCKQLGLEFVGIELNSDYIKLARRRIASAKVGVQ